MLENRCTVSRSAYERGGDYYHGFGKGCAGKEAVVTTVRRAEARGLRPHNCVEEDPITL
ncbi:MAG: hypothetical protein VW362_08075 [Candidatus Nanopelagicales bacterium]